ncbi:MAG: hypothetical protein KDD10_15135 [Phaeodactylibacter sp.]|nr:hypothetical protein [Phaeodactylibacter sp.]
MDQFFILSDMVESGKGPGRRDFHANPIQDKAEALAFAAVDAKTIASIYAIAPAALQGCAVEIRTPYQSLEASHIQMNRYYWEALFGAFGVREVRFR